MVFCYIVIFIISFVDCFYILKDLKKKINLFVYNRSFDLISLMELVNRMLLKKLCFMLMLLSINGSEKY